MIELMNRCFTWFTYQTGILGEIRKYQSYSVWLLLILGFAACFLGFRVYRVFFSLFVFGTIAVACCVFMRGRTNWGAVVTCFAVVGTVMAFLAYHWHRLGGCIVCGLIGMGIGWLLVPSFWGILAGGIIAAVFMLQFPVLAICFMTAVWGGGVLSELGIIPGGTVLFVLASAAGFAAQMVLNRGQKLFPKVCPDKVRYWIEKRKK